MKTPIIALAAASLAITASPALAGGDQQTMDIQYSDLNLGSEAGIARLENRIEKAAREVCGVQTVRTGTRLKSLSGERCVKNAKAQAMKQFASVIERERLGG
ncbi:UrcA family protein [Erythrobacter sp. W53]|uniref:UrcA family protein n=1 Tax=Erythrobacteraceae TaxID=335929 RepID=UPI0036D26AF3